MGSNSKWVDGKPDDSVRRVARRALSSRLERMWHYLELAVRAPRSETENVHQLRVFSRRAAAAMEIFEAWLPTRRGRSIRKKIKHVRKAAGAARDFDVLLLRWSQRLEQTPSPLGSLLLEEITRHRHEAQPPIRAVHEKLTKRRFLRKTSKLLERIRDRVGAGPCDERFGCMARVAMGNAPASLNPKTKRVTVRDITPVVRPVTITVSDQNGMMASKTRRGPKRSPSHPPGICPIA